VRKLIRFQFYFILLLHFYEGYLDIVYILQSSNFTWKFKIFYYYFLLCFLIERLLGVWYLYKKVGGKFSHLIKKCDCCQNKYLNLLKIFLSFALFIEWKAIEWNWWITNVSK
jgi:hypothetical protein